VRRILVVDDDRSMVRTLCDVLGMHGWEAHGRFSGEEAVAAFATDDYAAVLMDVRMEGIDGVEALQRIRALRPMARVVLMTAFSSADLLKQAEEEGALEIMSKPVSLPKLVDVLENALKNGGPVLVVDDDPDFLRSISDPLRARGFSILEASSLDQALGLLSEKTPVAAVLDLRLSDFPLEAVLAFKRASPAVALILCSGDHGLVDLTSAQAPRGSVYASVRKPFSPDHLIELLDDIVQRT